MAAAAVVVGVVAALAAVAAASVVLGTSAESAVPGAGAPGASGDSDVRIEMASLIAMGERTVVPSAVLRLLPG